MKSFALILLAALSAAMSSEALAKDGKPKVFFIISNDLTSTALGYHSNKICQTPNIDRLAAKGMGFTRAYCQGT
jgi:iduronate 2-sulfatase